MADYTNLSDAELDARIAKARAPAQAGKDYSHLSDAELDAKIELASAPKPPQEDHSLWGAVKGAGNAALGAVNALGTRPLTDIAYDHLVKPAVDTYGAHRDAGEGVLQSALAAGAQGTGDLARVGRNMIVPATVPVDAGIDSYNRGNSLGDAARDAGNAAVIVGAPTALGAAASAVTSPLAKAAGSDLASLLPNKVTGLANGEVAQLLKGKVADAFDSYQAAQAAPSSVAPGPTSIRTRDIFSEGGRPLMPAASMGDAIVSAAAQKGPQAAATAHYLATQRDPAYAAAQQKKGK